MIITRLIGGLGNQLFQYAAGRRLAVLHNTKLKLDISGFTKKNNREYLLNNFNISAEIATKDDLRHFKPQLSLWNRIFFSKKEIELFHLFSEKHFYFYEEFLLLPDNSYLDGYWQSYKYFEDISELIREECTLKFDIPSVINNVLQEIQDFESVAIHIRLGDYITNPEAHSFHGVCSPSYYYNAIDFIKKFVVNPHFFIFSDDIQLAKKRFPLLTNNITYIEDYSGKHSYLDMYLMSKCRHFIIANSTFSWWSAWLGSNPDKIVIAPKKWFSDSSIITKDLYLPTYVLI